MQKYLPHIRIPFKLFDDERIRKIPEEHRSSSLLILIALLKFVNTQNGQCYPRQATISSMVCLHRSTIYRCTELLQEVGILKTKRLKSTLLYTIHSDYLVHKKYNVASKDSNVSLKHMTGRMMHDISKPIIKQTIISNLVKEIVSNGGDKEHITDKLATLPRNTLTKAIQEKDNPYYCSLAISKQDEKGKGVLVDIPKNIINEIRKKSHFGYQQKVSKTKRDHDRKIKSKDLLRGNSKD